MSTDAAHSLGDALGVDRSARRRAAGPRSSPACTPSRSTPSLGSSSPGGRCRTTCSRCSTPLGIDPVAAEELTVAARGRGGRWRCWSCARRSSPGRGTSSSSTARRPPRRCGCWRCPRRSRWHLDRLLPPQRGLMRALRPAAAAAAGVPLPGAAVLDAVQRLARQLREVQRPAHGPTHTSVRLVLTPERVVLAEARRTLTSLALYGFAVDGVVVNRVFPDAATGRRRRPARPTPGAAAWNAAQQQGLVGGGGVVRRAAGGRRALPRREPIGPDALDDARRACTRRRGRRPARAARPRRGHDASRARPPASCCALPLPLVSAADVDLGGAATSCS